MKRSIERRGLAGRRSAQFGLVLSCLVGLASTDCSRDHGALAARPRTEGGTAGAAGTAGAGGISGSGSGFSGSGGTFLTRGGTGGGGGSGGSLVSHPRPPLGQSVGTFLHAMVDAPVVTLCFAKNDGGRNEFVGTPLPERGLGYGRTLVLEALKGVDLEEESLVPFAITGDLSLLDGMKCDEAVAFAEAEVRAANRGGSLGAGGEAGAPGEAGSFGSPSNSGGNSGDGEPIVPRLRVARLPELAPSALSAGHSLLYAMVGCIGGPTFTHEDEEVLCGEGYAPDRPTASADVVLLWRRRSASTIGIQVLHASRALPALSVRAKPPDDAVQPSVYIVDSITEGMLRPREPRSDTTAVGYGIGTRTWRVQALTGGNVVVSDSWDVVTRRGALAELRADGDYTLVVMGPSRVVAAAPLWNQPGFTIVDNDPTLASDEP
jgi:hypothetical protein